MNKNDLIKEVNEEHVKSLIEKYSITDRDYNLYFVPIKAFNEWYEKNKNCNTMGGKVSTYDVGGAFQLFSDEICYCLGID